jgi:hypothetical protein
LLKEKVVKYIMRSSTDFTLSPLFLRRLSTDGIRYVYGKEQYLGDNICFDAA